MKEWADLHHHSESSLLDGFGNIDVHVERCVERGHTAVAMTEHGTCRGFVALDAACKRHGIRPVYGCELYVTRDHRARGLTPEQEAAVTVGLKGKAATEAKKRLARELGVTESRHLIALAADEEGFRNLIKLVNIANRKGFYYRPKIDLDLLAKHSGGLYVNSGCIGSVVSQSVLRGDLDRALDDFEWFIDVFGDRFSLELQPHPFDEQETWNRIALTLADEYGVKLVIANDSHYPTREDCETHDAIVAIGHGKLLEDCDRMRYEADTFWLHSHREMVDEFARNHPYVPRATVLAALERAAEIADACRAELPRPKTVLLPKVTDDDPDEVLRELCFDGWGWRDISERAERRRVPVRDYTSRLAYELGVVRDKGFAEYFLVVHELVQWSRGAGILISCRGSAVGSLVCYLLGITPIDPLEHGLLFDRFLAPGRPDWPDIDLDIEDRRRGEMFEHLADRYGADKVARISNVVRMAGRTAFRDSAKTHGVPYVEADSVSTVIVDPVTREDRTAGRDTVAEARKSSPTLKRFDARFPGVLDLAEKIEGHVRHVGVHAAGVVCSPVPFDEFCPIERRLVNQQEVLVTAYDYRDCEKIGLVKLDVLGLTTLSVLADALRLVETRTGERPDLERLPLDSDEVFEAFTDRDFLGVFQFDTPAARAMCSGVVFRSFDDITTLNAINRPGPAASGLADLWRDRNADKETEEGDPVVERICADSLGVLVYQEQIMRILDEVAGYDPVEVGKIRKAVAKSKGVGFLEDERDNFVDGAVEVGGMDERDADKLWTKIEQFGAYSFNKSHSAAYAAVAYWCQWVKLNHPAEFFCALLSNEGEVGKVGHITREAARRGVPIEPPDVNGSGERWALRGGSLLAGLAGIKGIGDKATAELVAAQHSGAFTDLPDLLVRVNRKLVHRGVLVSLAKAGALRELVPNTRWFIEHAESLLALKGRKRWEELINKRIEESRSEPDYDAEDLQALRLQVGLSLAEHPLDIVGPMLARIGRDDPGPCNIDEIRSGSWVRGVVTSRKVGTGHGEKWARIELEDETGSRLAIKFGDAEYKAFRPVIDLGLGAVLAAWVVVSKSRAGKAARAALLVDLLGMRAKWRDGEDLDWQERSFCKGALHPTRHRVGHDPLTTKWWRNKRAPVLVVSRRVKRDRTGKKMAWVRVDPGTPTGLAEVVVFGSLWPEVGRLLKPGNVVEMYASKGEDKRRRGLVCKAVWE